MARERLTVARNKSRTAEQISIKCHICEIQLQFFEPFQFPLSLEDHETLHIFLRASGNELDKHFSERKMKAQ